MFVELFLFLASWTLQSAAYSVLIVSYQLLLLLFRDTMSFATKLCHVVYADGSAHDVMKHPATDKGKISLPGKKYRRWILLPS
jgi:hypothetical protein